MIVYAACYTDCYHEYSPAVFSLHLTKEGALKAIVNNKLKSEENHQDQIKWCKENDFGYDNWSEEKGSGFERWNITEMEIGE